MISSNAETEAGQRGPADHAIREQVVTAAKAHFIRYGYAKTTVSDLAEAIGISKAYIYKFFESKQAIGEVICGGALGAIDQGFAEVVASARTPTEKLRKGLETMVESSTKLFFSERKLYDIAAHSCLEKWRSSNDHWDRVLQRVSDIVSEGRKKGEFERKTALDETSRSIVQAMQPFINPLHLQHNLDLVPTQSNEVIRLILRSLAP
ncbi:TetR family transcriptional regulator [Panacagrimonas perspica]|uniref:TetR family transcriptional regulator n=1 Tax=Panacagrimonas perspica TaxID=381431 RepID=A0A4R7PEE2_9GAMM|nr:TetR/AcrR family transcriptional regulator [Panacagrimonas perspica]TDU32574.1 TetR family transcriptional regulator [Panacagrimonas perspica]THD05471.1 TetR family transcriptional regulator [Panacagrimonas perspica]